MAGSEVAQQALRMLLPALKVFVSIVSVVLILAALYYYLFIYLRRRSWEMTIKEQKSDGKLHTINFDKLIERKFNFGKKTFFWLRRAKVETIPPPDDIVDRVGKKDYVTYLKIRFSYVPLQQKMKGDTVGETPYKKAVVNSMNTAMSALHDKDKFKTSFRSAKSVYERFVYVPVNYIPHVNVGYHSMDYDIDMMRINRIDNLNEMFASQKDWWQKWGMMVTIGVIAALIIVVMYFTYEHGQKIIELSYGKTQEVVSALEKVAQAFGGSKPPV